MKMNKNIEWKKSDIDYDKLNSITHKLLVISNIGKDNKARKHSLESSIKKSLATKGVKKSKEHIKKISNSLKGKEKTLEHKKKLSESKIGKGNLQTSKRNSELNSKVYQCKFCKRDIGGYANYVRFHNDNCKHKK